MGPGFDTIGMALRLYNYLEMKESRQGLKIEALGQDAGYIPLDQRNVVYQAAKQVFKVVGYFPKGLSIRQTINIPTSRGMGSSASAIVGGLVAANQLIGNKLSKDKLLQMAAKFEGHPDNVAPAMLGGIVVSANLDDQQIYRRIDPPKFWPCPSSAFLPGLLGIFYPNRCPLMMRYLMSAGPACWYWP